MCCVSPSLSRHLVRRYPLTAPPLPFPPSVSPSRTHARTHARTHTNALTPSIPLSLRHPLTPALTPSRSTSHSPTSPGSARPHRRLPARQVCLPGTSGMCSAWGLMVPRWSTASSRRTRRRVAPRAPRRGRRVTPGSSASPGKRARGPRVSRSAAGASSERWVTVRTRPTAGSPTPGPLRLCTMASTSI